ncbi:2-dehydropantoate 2-reductase [Actinomycetota bacterium]
MSEKTSRLRVAVLGAGAIGCYLGGRLADTCEVTLIGRPRVITTLREQGLRVTPLGEQARQVAEDHLRLSTTPSATQGADVVLVCVKSTDTATAATELAPHLSPDTVVISFQNGLHNPDILREHLAGQPVLTGMVPFNVAVPEPGHYVQGTSGRLMVGYSAKAEAFEDAALRAGLEIELREDMDEIQRGKLLVNMNNAVNALSGLPLREQLGQRAYRQVVALCMDEGAAVFAAARLKAARISAVPASLMARSLRLPDRAFSLVAGRTLRVDPRATSSMADDFALGRPTEIDQLQGEIVRLGEQHGVPTPVCRKIVELVRESEAAGPKPPHWSGPALLAAVTEGDGDEG